MSSKCVQIFIVYISHSLWPSHSTWKNYPKEIIRDMCKILKGIHHNAVDDKWRFEKACKSINRELDKWIMIYL